MHVDAVPLCIDDGGCREPHRDRPTDEDEEIVKTKYTGFFPCSHVKADRDEDSRRAEPGT